MTLYTRRKMFHVKLLLLLFLAPFVAVAQHSTTTTMEVKPLPLLPPKDASIVEYVSSFQQLRELPASFSEWFYWTNYSRRKPKAFWDSVVVPLLNTYPNLNTSYATSLKKELYQTQGLSFVKPNVSLLRVAQGHALDLAKNTPGQLSHNSTNGTAFEKRIFGSGIQKCAAENLSLGPFNTALALVLLYIDEGLSTTGHRKNLLNPYYTEMGLGIAKTKGDLSLIVQDFACDQSK